MQDAFLANTSTEGLTPLGTAPQRSFELISGTVRDRLGDRHADLFAEPVATPHGDRFDWYALGGGKYRPLSDLEEDDRATALNVLNGLISEISDSAQALLDSTNPDDQRLGEALNNAVQYPNEEAVFVAGSGTSLQPVLVNWAWTRDTQTVVTGSLSGAGGRTRANREATARQQAQAAAPAAAPVAAAAATGPRNLWWLLWLGWLLLLLLIATILYLMIEACALKIPGWSGYCEEPQAEASGVERDTLALQDQIRTLEQQLAINDRACQPTAQAQIEGIPAPQLAQPPVQNDVDDVLDQAGAQRGDLTFSLIWQANSDLDLHVICATGQEIYFGNRQVCNGTLDIDSFGAAGVNSVENTFFDNPSPGTYQIRVNYFSAARDQVARNFQIHINDNGRVQTIDGTVSAQTPIWTYSYRFGGQ